MTEMPAPAECPACTSARTRTLVAVRVPLVTGALHTHILSCRACGHRFMGTTEAQQRAVEEIYGYAYRGYEYDPVFARRVREALDAHIAPRQPPPARVLDVGCGNGEFLLAAAERGYQAEGIDVSETAAELCRRRGATAQATDIFTADFGAPFDIVTMWDVVEHLRSPAPFLRRVRELLHPGGLLVLKIPGFGALSFPPIAIYPRLAGSILGAPAHLQYFNAGSLRVLLTTSGFSQVEWLPPRAFRGRTTGGPVRRRISRTLARVIAAAARNQTLFVAARPVPLRESTVPGRSGS